MGLLLPLGMCPDQEGIKPITFWCLGPHPIQLSHPAQLALEPLAQYLWHSKHPRDRNNSLKLLVSLGSLTLPTCGLTFSCFSAEKWVQKAESVLFLERNRFTYFF